MRVLMPLPPTEVAVPFQLFTDAGRDLRDGERRYYRTYPAYVEDEVRAALGPEGTFERGPTPLVSRGTRDDHRAAFVVED